MDGLVVKGDLVLKVWQEAFRKLFAADEQDPAFDRTFMLRIKHEVAQEEVKGIQVDNICEQLNAPIALQEVISVLHNLRNGKAGGIDSLINEIVKYGGNDITVATWRLCEAVFRLEKIPQDWARGLIFPLFREGDARVPDNYRGITLLSVVGKIYTTVLNARINRWCEDKNILVEEQAGFRVGRSTVDHIFVFNEILRARRKQGKETYCCFLDIRKAYDRSSGMVCGIVCWKRAYVVNSGGYYVTSTRLWRVVCWLVMTEQSGFLLMTGFVRAVFCPQFYLPFSLTGWLEW